MTHVTRLYCSRPTTGDAKPSGRLDRVIAIATPKTFPSAAERRPVVVWNSTRTCNLNCANCYTDSWPAKYAGELSTAEARTLLEDLAQFGVPGLLFAGGEPLLRRDIPELIAYASELGIRPVLGTNGTLMTPAMATRLKRAGVSSVDISLDSIGEDHDSFWGKNGMPERSMAGFRHCVEAGLEAGLRMKLTKRNFRDLEAVFDFLERENIRRVCFGHLVYAGRGNDPAADLSHQETRHALDFILHRAKDFHRRGLDSDIVTVNNEVDGIYIYLKLLKNDPVRAVEVYRLLKHNGGGAYGSGVGIGNVDNQGNVHADQFWTSYTFGNIRQRPFSQIWMDTSDPLMAGLKNRLPLLKGRCATCGWKALCGGNLRVRAEEVYGDPWMPDPACYLTSDENRQQVPHLTEAVAEEMLLGEEAA